MAKRFAFTVKLPVWVTDWPRFISLTALFPPGFSSDKPHIPLSAHPQYPHGSLYEKTQFYAIIRMAPSMKKPRYQFSEISVDEHNPIIMDVPGAPLRFKIRLYHDYNRLAILPKVSRMGEGNRWVTIDPENGHQYRVEMVDAVGAFLFRRGWDIVTITENLQEDDVVMFLQKAPDVYILWATWPVQHPSPLGFSIARSPPDVIQAINPDQIIVSKKTPDNALVPNTILKVWNASSIGGPIYICRLLNSPSKGDFLIFNTKYSKLIPKKQSSVSMRYVGSDLVLPGAIKTYDKDNCARMVKEWPMYAKQHSLTWGEIFVCKIHRGPGTWEFIGCCARPE